MERSNRRVLKTTGLALVLALLCLGAGPLFGAGVLQPKQADAQPIQIKNHHVNVTINNGFAMTEVIQTFYNPNPDDLEAIYSFPLPKSASLSEVILFIDEQEINGEVLAKDRARKIYEEEKSQGNDTGLAEKNDFYTFEFSVYPVRAHDATTIRFLYYQPLEIDHGMGRYLYPLREGGTDEAARSFWTVSDEVEEFFTVDLKLHSAWPVSKVRTPGYTTDVQEVAAEEGISHFQIKMEKQQAKLDQDFVLYYRLAENLPGRVEIIPYRPDPSKPGSFMMVITPGMDLQSLTNGADYTFVLDISGSMKDKIRILADGVAQTLGQMNPNDRFRIITFNKNAYDLTNGWEKASPDKVRRYIEVVKNMRANGGTNLYAGIREALDDLDDDRATSIILVTDAVTNEGVVEPKAFAMLMKKYDVRIFGFVLGNSGNWPLMRVICETSGGFSAGVSNTDDIIGQILLAKSKITSECLHHAEMKISGVRVFDHSSFKMGKVYRGEQLVFFGRYQSGGEVEIKLEGRMTGEDKTYRTTFEFPDLDTRFPEVERLWALDRIEYLEYLTDIGEMEEKECASSVLNLGLDYQLVTDETSMLVLSDEKFIERGIERRNANRVTRENQARTQRAQQPVTSKRVDKKRRMFSDNAPSPRRSGGSGFGGGAFDPITLGLALAMALLAFLTLTKRDRI